MFYPAGTATFQQLQGRPSKFISIGQIAVTQPMERVERPSTLIFNMTSPGASGRILSGVSDTGPHRIIFAAPSEFLSTLKRKRIGSLVPSYRTKSPLFPTAFI